MLLTADEILTFLSEELSIDTSDIDSETLLFSTGIIDSFALITLVSFLERRCSFRMNPMDVNLEHLDNIQRILAFVGRVTGDS